MGIRLADIALDVGALRACVHVPVHEAGIVTLRVGAVLGEFLAEAEERRAVQSGEKTLGDGPGDEIEVGAVKRLFG